LPRSSWTSRECTRASLSRVGRWRPRPGEHAKRAREFAAKEHTEADRLLGGRAGPRIVDLREPPRSRSRGHSSWPLLRQREPGSSHDLCCGLNGAADLGRWSTACDQCCP
jgi:hypothetical protein